MMEEFDVIVVGAGVMGSSTAYNCINKGCKTLLLEQVTNLTACINILLINTNKDLNFFS